MAAEGWYRDPFGLHEDRWISEGNPTALVRDNGIESYDASPSVELSDVLEPDDGPEPHDGEDLLRADEANDTPTFKRAVTDVFVQTSHRA